MCFFRIHIGVFRFLHTLGPGSNGIESVTRGSCGKNRRSPTGVGRILKVSGRFHGSNVSMNMAPFASTPGPSPARLGRSPWRRLLIISVAVLVAVSVLEVPEFRERYRSRVGELATKIARPLPHLSHFVWLSPPLSRWAITASIPVCPVGY